MTTVNVPGVSLGSLPLSLNITRSEIASNVVPFASIAVSGATNPGDAGTGAVYVRGTSSGSNAIQDAAGIWFEEALPPPGTAAAKDVGYFATAAQGAKADTAVQPSLIGITRAQIAARTMPFDTFMVSGNTIPGDPGMGAIYTSGTSAGPRAIQDAAGAWFELSCGGVADLGHWGGALDGETADDTVWDAAYAYLMSLPRGGEIVLPAGTKIRLNASHNIYGSKPLSIHFGASSKVYCGLTGAASVLFDASNPVTPSTRGFGTVIYGKTDISFHSSVASNTVGAVFFQARYASDLKIVGEDHLWVHNRNNTALRISGPWNCDLRTLSIWAAGHRKPRKSTGTATFSITYNTTTLTASSAVFDAGDVGDIIVVADEMFTISAYTSPTQVTVSRAASQTLTAQRASFGSVRCTVAAASTAVTLESAVASSSDIGRVVYIAGARDLREAPLAGPPKEWLRATIVDVPSTTQITIDIAPDYNITLGEIIFSPAVEIYYDNGAFDGQPNDIVINGLDIPYFRGCGLMLDGGTFVWLPNLKVHGVEIGIVNETASDYCIVNNNCNAQMAGQLEGITAGRLGRVVVSGLASLFKIDEVMGAGTRRQPLLHAMDMSAGGVVEVGDWYAYNYYDTTSVVEAFKKTGSYGRLSQNGRVTALLFDPTVYPRIYGEGRPPYAFLPTWTEALVARPGAVNFGMMSPSTTTFFGCATGGTVEAPTSTSDFQTAAALAGYGLAPSGIAAMEFARISMVARSPSGSNLAGQISLDTRDTSGTLATRWIIDPVGDFTPVADNANNIGWASGRVKEIFAANATINTSDAREKQDIGAIPNEWLDAWGDVQWHRYRWIDAVAEKGDTARWHVGLIAQDIGNAFAARGLDARAIGLLCFDEWPEEPGRPEIPAQIDEDGRELAPARPGVPSRPAGSRWGVRYTECLAMEAAYVRRRLDERQEA